MWLLHKRILTVRWFLHSRLRYDMVRVPCRRYHCSLTFLFCCRWPVLFLSLAVLSITCQMMHCHPTWLPASRSGPLFSQASQTAIRIFNYIFIFLNDVCSWRCKTGCERDWRIAHPECVLSCPWWSREETTIRETQVAYVGYRGYLWSELCEYELRSERCRYLTKHPCTPVFCFSYLDGTNGTSSPWEQLWLRDLDWI